MSQSDEPMYPEVRVGHYRKWGLRIGEIWFEESTIRPKSDLLEFVAVPQPIGGALCTQTPTLIVPLCHPDEAAILRKMEKTTRYEIRLAENRDKVSYEHRCPKALHELSDFTQAYESEVMRGNPSLSLNLKRIAGLAEAGVLDLSFTRNEHDQVLSWHLNVVGRRIARMFHSVTMLSTAGNQQQKNVRGRANRFHCWMDMRRFRAAGFVGYDFGGWYTGDQDQKKLQINQFKRGFGGEVTCKYNCLYPLTKRGSIALKARNWMRRSS